MNILRKKTTATLLIAIFMISTLAVVYAIPPDPLEGEHLNVPIEPVPTEARIVIDVCEGFTLEDLMSISWSVYMEYGYPLHVDITLGDVPELESMLTAEIAYNNFDGKEWDEGLEYTYGGWLKTFELTTGDGFDEIDDGTMFWVTKMGAGNDDAPYGTLAQWKAGEVGVDPKGELLTTKISASTPVLMLEFEIDNWLGEADAYVKDILVNGLTTDLLLEVLPPIVSIMVSPASVDFGKLKYGAEVHKEVTVFNVGDIAVTVKIETTGTFFIANLAVSDPGEIAPNGQSAVDLGLTVPYGAVAGIHEGQLVFTATPVYPG